MAARRLHALVYATIASCCLVIVICSVSLGTDQWFSSEAHLDFTAGLEVIVTVNYGLFKGEKFRKNLADQRYDLKIVCKSAKCMFSCGTDADLRKKDLEQILGGDYTLDTEGGLCVVDDETEAADARKGFSNFSKRNASSDREVGTRAEENFEPKLLNFGMYIATIAFLVLAMIFAALGGGLAVYNTYRTPIQPILSVFGLYIWNGITAGCVLLAMIMWVMAFASGLRNNAGINETLTGIYDSEGEGKLGISFWILIIGVVLPFINIGILAFRSWKITKMEETNVKVMTEKLESGDILLF